MSTLNSAHNMNVISLYCRRLCSLWRGNQRPRKHPVGIGAVYTGAVSQWVSLASCNHLDYGMMTIRLFINLNRI